MSTTAPAKGKSARRAAHAAADDGGNARTKLLNAALNVIRAQGYAGTTVDDLCSAAGVTKGAFFHHFDSKADFGVAAADHWSRVTGALFAAAPYHAHDDPLDRVLAYIDLRKALLTGALEEFTCLVGTMAQETFATQPEIAAACGACIGGHAGTIAEDIQAAMDRYGIAGDWTAESLALHTQAVLQGAFILAKAKPIINPATKPTGKDAAAIAADSVDHLRRYVELLFGRGTRTAATATKGKDTP